MAFIQDISVSIIRGTKALAQQGFGMPLIVGNTTTAGVPGVYREFGDMTSVAQVYSDTDNEYQMASMMFAQEPSPKEIAIFSRNTETITNALTTVNESNPGFYAVFIADRDSASLAEAGDWANANKKFFFGGTSDETALTGRNVDREAYIVHNEADKYPECAWAGMNLPKDPGSITWKWKSLNGQNAANYTLTELNTIRDANGQTITEVGGVAVVNEGKCTSGEFIDVIRGQDWVKARIEENLYQLFISNDKIAMDNVGIAQVESTIRSVLKMAGNRGIIAKATTETELTKSDDKEFMYQVTVPRREDITVNDRANRILPGVEFIYYLAGAIHEAEVKGKITV